MRLRNYSIIGQGVLICLSLIFLTAAKPEKVAVNEAVPNSAEQGTTVPVLIKGSGFAPGATVAFWRSGTTNPGGVTVLAVTVHDSNNLTANIDVALAADIDNYDIQVQAGRRKGKGTELFSVKLKGGGGGNKTLGDDYTATDGVTFISPSIGGLFDHQITGTIDRDEIYGGDDTDLIEGGDEHDYIEARGGADEIHGGGESDSIFAGSGNDVIYGDDGNDQMNGDDGDDILFGGPGTDYMNGGLGSDFLYGEYDDDVLHVSLGALSTAPDQYDGDYYDGGPGHDSLNFPQPGSNTQEHNEVSVFIDLSLSVYQLTVPDQYGMPVTVTGNFVSIEQFWMTDGPDVFVGVDNVPNDVYGGAGNDFIQTFNGDDIIAAGFGNDVVYAGDGDDFIQAEVGNDVLYGEGGNDILSGYGNGAGTEQDDVMWGGDGCDIFTFSTAGTETVMDFGYPYDEPPCDTINFSYRGWFQVDFNSLDIQTVGNDIVISHTIKKGGGKIPTTVIVKDAALRNFTLDESNITFIEEGMR